MQKPMTADAETKADITRKFWSALRSDMTVMLATKDPSDTPRPMTAQFQDDQDHGPIYFFGSKSMGLAPFVAAGAKPSQITFMSKGHDLFATVDGQIALSEDRAVIDALWNPFIAAWFKGGKDDPDLALLRFDPEEAEIWLNEVNLLAGLKMLFGFDPKADYESKMAQVKLG